MRRFSSWIAVGLAVLAGAAPLAAQPTRLTMLDFATGSEFEEYLRALQLAGIAPLYPWSIRGFSPREVRHLAAADTAGPWRVGSRLSRSRVALGGVSVAATFNSEFPHGANDGPVWAGRGLTVQASAGVAGRFGPLSAVVAPLAFRAANRPFDIVRNGMPEPQAFGHAVYASGIDLPQRFGAEPYARLDHGASNVRIDTPFLTAGASTGNEWIGPATEYPFLLGTNAPGFPHLFAGSGAPLNLLLAKVHFRVTWGRLHQSPYSIVTGPAHFDSGANTGTERLMTSAVLVVTPRGIPGLELGLARFLHVPNTQGSPDSEFWRKPFKVFFQKNEFSRGEGTGGDNQLASLFFRWVAPRAGFEVYGERGQDDQFYDLREYIMDADHLREYTLGLQKAVGRRRDRLDVIRFELMNQQMATLARVRVEGPIYIHYPLRQGHTNRGQLLGTSAGAGATAASTLAWTRYSSGGRTSGALRRITRAQRGTYYQTGVADPKSTDVLWSASLERVRFGRWADVGARAEWVRELNRNFERDASNLHLQLTARFRGW